LIRNQLFKLWCRNRVVWSGKKKKKNYYLRVNSFCFGFVVLFFVYFFKSSFFIFFVLCNHQQIGNPFLNLCLESVHNLPKKQKSKMNFPTKILFLILLLLLTLTTPTIEANNTFSEDNVTLFIQQHLNRSNTKSDITVVVLTNQGCSACKNFKGMWDFTSETILKANNSLLKPHFVLVECFTAPSVCYSPQLFPRMSRYPFITSFLLFDEEEHHQHQHQHHYEKFNPKNPSHSDHSHLVGETQHHDVASHPKVFLRIDGGDGMKTIINKNTGKAI
jgi:hypothetical protein